MGMQRSNPVCCCIFCSVEICRGDVIVAVSAVPVRLLLLSSASNERSVRGGSCVNTAVANSWSVTGREANLSRPLECVDLQLISNSLDFSC